MKNVLFLILMLITVSGFSQKVHSKQSISISPKSQWIAVGKSKFGRPYEITISKFNQRDPHNSDGTIFLSFTLNSMLHNEYFALAKDPRYMHNAMAAYRLGKDEITDAGLTTESEDPIVLNIKHRIFQENDSLARNFGRVNFQFNPVITSINFYDENTLLIYGNLGIFVLTFNKIVNGQFINELSLLVSAEFNQKNELVTYYTFLEHKDGILIVERKNVRMEGMEQLTESGGIYEYSLKTKTLVKKNG